MTAAAASPTPSVKVYSTGQTMDDFIKLSKIVALIPEAARGSLKPPPALLDPNYTPPNRGAALFAGFLILGIFANIAVGLRTYSRLLYAPRRLSAEDYIILTALAILEGITAVCCYGCMKLQWGYYMFDWTFHSIYTTGEIIFAHQMLASADVFLIRIALILFIRRLYLRSGSNFVYVCNFLVGTMVVIIVGIVLGVVFQCGVGEKVRGNWDLIYRVQIMCSPTNMNWIQNAINMAADTVVLLLPLRIALRMMMRTFWERVRTWALLGLGVLAWSASIARFVYIRNFNTDGNIASVINAIFATQFELCIAICCSCAPAIKSLVASAFPSKDKGSSFGTPSNATPVVTVGVVERKPEERRGSIKSEDGVDLERVATADTSKLPSKMDNV